MTIPGPERFNGHADGSHFIPKPVIASTNPAIDGTPIENDDAGDSTEHLDKRKEGAD